MIVRDEADVIARCLQNTVGLVDEIVVVDTGSTDDTIAICQSFGARIHTFTWRNDFAAARNHSLEQASGEWVLVLDADDELPDHISRDVRALTEDENSDAYFFVTRNLVGDPRHPLILNYAQLRLFRNQRRFRYTGAIHETILRLPDVRYGMAAITVTHRGYLDDVVQNRKKIERNVFILSGEIRRAPLDSSLHYYMGNELLRGGEPVRAACHYEQAMTLLGLGNAQYWLPELPAKYAYALWQTGRTDPAVAVVRRALAQYPAYTDLWFLLGSLQLDRRHMNQARAAFQECLRLGTPPPFFPTQEGIGSYLPAFFLGVIAFEERNIAVARTFFVRSWEWNPDYVPSVTQLCLCDWIEGKYAAVDQRLQSITSHQANDPVWEVVRLVHESLVTGRIHIRLDDPRHTSSLLACLSALASFDCTEPAGRLLRQLPSSVRGIAMREQWYYELSGRCWLAAYETLEWRR